METHTHTSIHTAVFVQPQTAAHHLAAQLADACSITIFPQETGGFSDAVSLLGTSTIVVTNYFVLRRELLDYITCIKLIVLPPQHADTFVEPKIAAQLGICIKKAPLHSAAQIITQWIGSNICND